MTRYFNTKEAAERHLEYRKKCAIKEIEKRGDKIIRDNSFVYQDYIWSKYDEKTHSVTQTNTIKWFTFLELVTYNMIMDLLQMKGLSEIQAEEEKLLKCLSEEENLRKSIDEGL